MIRRMERPTPARRRFRRLIRQPETHLDLAEAALCIAWEDQGQAQLDVSLQQLDFFAQTARERLLNMTVPSAVIATLNDYLFDELQFRGNTWNYTDPSNSYLDHVLATRTGLPIMLSLVYLEIGWRLGLPLVGLALPGHFLVRYPVPEGDIVVDPFNRGRLWSLADCEQQVATVYNNVSPALMERAMAPPTKHAILARILHNLKSSYVERQDWARALAAVDRLLLLDRTNAAEFRDRGLLRARLGQLHAALLDLDYYVRHSSNPADIPALRQQARAIGEHLAARN